MNATAEMSKILATQTLSTNLLTVILRQHAQQIKKISGDFTPEELEIKLGDHYHFYQKLAFAKISLERMMVILYRLNQQISVTIEPWQDSFISSKQKNPLSE